MCVCVSVCGGGDEEKANYEIETQKFRINDAVEVPSSEDRWAGSGERLDERAAL